MDFCSDSKLYDAEKLNYKVNMITSNFIMMMFIHNLRCFLQNILFPFLSALKIRFKWFIMHHTRDQIDFKTIFFFLQEMHHLVLPLVLCYLILFWMLVLDVYLKYKQGHHFHQSSSGLMPVMDGFYREYIVKADHVQDLYRPLKNFFIKKLSLPEKLSLF